MRTKAATILLLMILSSTISTANPGGEGDAVQSRDCAGSCHASSSTNGVSSANLSIELPDEIYAGLLMEIQTSVGNVDVSSNSMVGMAILINSDGAKDLPANSGWEIITDPNGGMNNYVEITGSFSSQNVVTKSWTLRAPSNPGMYDLFLAVQHGSPNGGVAMSGISSLIQVEVSEVPENLPQLAPDWTPMNIRNLGEETTIRLETLNTDSATVELKIGAEISEISVDDGEFTIPAAVNPGVVEWRVVLEGEGPTQTSPWFRLTAQEPGWEIDETALYLQSIALFLLCAGLVILRRPAGDGYQKNYHDTDPLSTGFEVEATQVTDQVPVALTQESTTSAGPPIPSEGLPAGWTMEQWQYYGQEHLDKLARGEIL
jgi:hypothetical protein